MSRFVPNRCRLSIRPRLMVGAGGSCGREALREACPFLFCEGVCLAALAVGRGEKGNQSKIQVCIQLNSIGDLLF